MKTTTRSIALMNCVLTSLFAGCGGDSSDRNRIDQGLTLQAGPYLNTMPMVVLPDQPIPCVSLIIPFRIRSTTGTVADDILIGRVTVGDGSTIVWSETSSPDETRLVSIDAVAANFDLHGAITATPADAKKETVLEGVARGCGNQNTPAGKKVVISVELIRGDETGSLSSEPAEILEVS